MVIRCFGNSSATQNLSKTGNPKESSSDDHRFDICWGGGQDVAAVAPHHARILDADATLAREVHPWLDGDDAALQQRLVIAYHDPQAWRFVNVQPGAMAGSMDVLVAHSRCHQHIAGRPPPRAHGAASLAA